MVETRDSRHTDEITEALREHGYPPRGVGVAGQQEPPMERLWAVRRAQAVLRHSVNSGASKALSARPPSL